MNGRPERQVHGAVECFALQHWQGLVVVHRQHGVVVTPLRRARRRYRPASGPSRVMPSARSASSTGMSVSISSCPRWPPSPACGLMPSTAMRGSARPNFMRSSLCTMRSVRVERLGRDRRRDRRQRQVGGRQGHAQLRAGQHHHHIGMRSLGEEFGMPAEADAGVVDRGFLQRRGDHRIVATGQAAVGCLGQRGQHMRGIARIRLAGYFLDRPGGRGARAGCRGGGSVALLPSSSISSMLAPQRAAARSSRSRSAIATRLAASGMAASLDKQLRADAGRLTGGQREPRQWHGVQSALRRVAGGGLVVCTAQLGHQDLDVGIGAQVAQEVVVGLLGLAVADGLARLVACDLVGQVALACAQALQDVPARLALERLRYLIVLQLRSAGRRWWFPRHPAGTSPCRRRYWPWCRPWNFPSPAWRSPRAC